MTPEPAAIRVLPRLVVDQIAAGEVVERPASVVRELLDNAIDAGSRSIDVTIEGGGRALLRVSDDGCGISGADLPLAFASHATSKLGSIEDLDHVATLGFRGEALASIGSVARVRLRSRSEGDAHGGEIDDDGGIQSAPRPAARDRGTDVEVRDLFFNTPARRRFLRRDATEAARASEVVLRHAIAHPEIGFRLTSEGRRVLDAPAVADAGDRSVSAARRARIAAAFGAGVEEDLRVVEETGRGVAVSGFVGGPASARRDASGVHLYVNGRFVRDRGALHVLREATRDFLGAQQPAAFLFVSLDPALVDVNVHPAKLEVRFREPSAVYGAIHRGVRRALEGSRPAASPDVLLGGTRREGVLPPAPLGAVREPGAPFGPAPAAPRQERLFDAAAGSATVVPRAAKFLRAFDTFFVLEGPEGIDLVDQHALHERVQFERLRARAGAGALPRQALLVPEVVEVSTADRALVEEHGPSWVAAGVEAEPFGPTSVVVRSVPAGLRRLRVRELLEDLLALAREDRSPGSPDLLEEILHRCACRSSVMAGDRLSDEEIAALLAEAATLPSEQTCPHGRPTRIRLGLRDLERAFERR